jgi:sentrin-specific protease 8
VFQQHAHKFLFVSPEVAQLLKMSEGNPDDARNFLPLHYDLKSYIFFPVNNNEADEEGGSHWSLLVFARPDNSFFTFDSVDTQNSRAATRLYDVLRLVLDCPDAQNINLPTAQQQNYYDCGIFVLRYVEIIVSHIIRGDGSIRNAPLLKFDNVAEKRKEILDIIVSLGGVL